MLRAVLMDDERPALHLLNRAIGERSDVQVVGAYTSPSEMLKDIPSLLPDMVFLDIEMPGMNGMEVAARLLELHRDIEIVFVTAYRQYAVEAFQVDALDYLLKPVQADLLNNSIERMKNKRKWLIPGKAESPAPQILCFGGFELYTADPAKPVYFPTAKAEELFAYLLVHRNRNISKWTLYDQLWPEVQAAEKNDHNLHMTVHRMKKTLSDSGIAVRLSSQRGFYRLECEAECDYVMLERAVALTAETDSGSMDALLRTIRLYKGPLFEGKDYPWCEAEQERISRLFASLSRKAANRLLTTRHYDLAIEVLLPILGYMPFDIEAHDLLLKAYAAMHNRTAFLSHYEKMKKSFLEELGVEPPETLRNLYDNRR